MVNAPVVVMSTVRHRPQTLGEEIANSVSHGVGFLAAVALLPVLVIDALSDGAAAVVGAAVFGATMALLYLTSTLYHAMAPSRAKRVFQILDHSAIYLLIAGTYTPFTLGVLRGAWGWTLFGVIWGLAAIGIFLKSVRGIRYPRLSTAVYLAMGWLVVVALKPLLINVPATGMFWLVAGGVAYTAGVIFYAANRMRYAHFVWHLFVLAGTTCHFVAVLRYSG
jgi:hemolysin III